MPRNRPRLRAHVATDYQVGDSRTFIFTPTCPDNRSHAAVELNEHGHVICHRSTLALSAHAAALTRWASIYLRRSTPVTFKQ